jgi:hypothetical protein
MVMAVPSVLTRGVVAAGALLLPLLLSACGVARSNQIAAKSPEELAVVSDRDICRGLTFNRDNDTLRAEAAKRRLGDCTDAHFLCVSWGGSLGSAAYVQCRSQLRAATIAAFLRPSVPVPPQTPVNCYATGADAGVVATCR